MHDEWELAQLARRGLGGGEPLLQARLVDILEAARAVAGRQQRVLGFAFAVANPTNVAAVLRCLAARRTEPGWTRDVRLISTLTWINSHLPVIHRLSCDGRSLGIIKLGIPLRITLILGRYTLDK